MGLWAWLRSLLLGAGDDRAPMAPEDPRRTLDRAYQRQLDIRDQVREGLAGVTAARKRVELQARQLDSTLGRLENQARASLAKGHEEPASQTLMRRAVLREQLGELREHSDQLAAEEATVRGVADRLDLEIERFRARVEAIKDAYTAAEARARLGESLAGPGREDFELRMALRRAEDLILAARARADAVDRLLAHGVLGDVALAPDAFLRELADSSAQAEVRSELARLRAEVKRQASSPLKDDDEQPAPGGGPATPGRLSP
jgi:phage shock protein A